MADVEFVIATGGKIRRLPAGGAKKDQQTEGLGLMGHLTYAQIWKMGTIFKSKLVRLDGQKSAGGMGANLQVQINDVKRDAKEGTTVAGVLVDGSLRDFGAMGQEKERKAIEAKVREALAASLKDGNNRVVKRK